MSNKLKEFINKAKEKAQDLRTKLNSVGGSGNIDIAEQWAKFMHALRGVNFDFVFSEQIRPKYHYYFKVGLIVIGSYGAGKTVALLLSTSPNLEKPANLALTASTDHNNTFRSLKNLSPFKTKKSDEKVLEATPKVIALELCNKAVRRSSTSTVLLSTIVLQDSVKSVAAVSSRGQKLPLTIREGDQLPNLGKVGKIEANKLIFRNSTTGECEYIAQEEKSPRIGQRVKILKEPSARKLLEPKTGIAASGNKFTIEKSYCQDQMGNISSVLTQAKATPIPSADGSLRFKLTQVKAGGLFAYLGVKDGDIITQINGAPVKALSEIMSRFTGICDMSNLSLTVQRSDEELNLEYEIQ